MKSKYQFILFLLALAVSHQVYAQVQNSSDMTRAKAVYMQRLYPFMQTNCAECHNEKAVDPAGPVHSNTDPNLAFPVFSKYINWNRPASSRIIKAVQSRHFCTDYNYNCKDSQKIADEMTALVTSYIEQVGGSSSVPATPTGSSTGQATGAPRVDQTAQNKTPSPANKLLFDNNQIVPKNDSFKLKWELNSVRTTPGSGLLEMRAEFRRYQDNYFRIESLSLLSDSGTTFEVQGVSLLINGQPTTAMTGFESIDRSIYFSNDANSTFPDANLMQLLLSAEKPMLELNPKDRISISFNKLVEDKSFPTKLCKSNEMMTRAVEVFNSTRGQRIPPSKELCFAMESQIDIQHPRRSILIEQNQALADQLLKMIQDWIDAAQIETTTSDDINN